MSSLCLRCLSRSINDLQRPLVSLPVIAKASFSSSTHLQATPPKKSKGVAVTAKKGGLRLKKTIRAKPAGRPPAPGERKANRKKIVLSNTNALEVRGLGKLSERHARSETLETAIGEVLAFQDASLDALRALQAFKATQGWGLFRSASTLVRSDTVDLARAIEQAEKQASHIVLTGKRASGKSVLQLQAVATAQLQGWVLIHIPEAQDLTIGTTAFQPTLNNTGKRTYIQPQYTAKLLEGFLKANETELGRLRLSRAHKLPIPAPDNISLARLADFGARDPSIAWPIFNVIIQELLAPSQEGQGLQRRPVMITIDGLEHIMKYSEYIDPKLNKIHAHELAIVSTVLDCMTGTTPMPNGGMVLAATSASNPTSTPTLDFILADRLSQAAQTPRPTWNPYKQRDELVDAALKDVTVRNVGGLSKEEAKGAMEYYALSGIFRDRITDATVAEKWSLSGGGIVGELEKSCVKQKF